MKTRIYVMRPKGERAAAGARARLVRASSRAQAYAHIARTTTDCEPASADDVAELMSEGVTVESPVTEDDEAGQPQPT